VLTAALSKKKQIKKFTLSRSAGAAAGWLA
jgi:hypothetical protein